MSGGSSSWSAGDTRQWGMDCMRTGGATAGMGILGDGPPLGNPGHGRATTQTHAPPQPPRQAYRGGIPRPQSNLTRGRTVADEISREASSVGVSGGSEAGPDRQHRVSLNEGCDLDPLRCRSSPREILPHAMPEAVFNAPGAGRDVLEREWTVWADSRAPRVLASEDFNLEYGKNFCEISALRNIHYGQHHCDDNRVSLQPRAATFQRGRTFGASGAT